MTKEERGQLLQGFGNDIFDKFLRHEKIVNSLNKFEATLTCDNNFTEAYIRIEDLGDGTVATLTINMDFILANQKHGNLISAAFLVGLVEKFKIKKRPFKGELDI